MTPAVEWAPVDPFELPEWLGEQELTWRLDGSLSASVVTGTLHGAEGGSLPMDVLCGDVAYPEPLVTEPVRQQTHQAWQYGQVLVVGAGDRTGLAVPASTLDAELVCEALRRFAKAIGIEPGNVSVTLPL